MIRLDFITYFNMFTPGQPVEFSISDPFAYSESPNSSTGVHLFEIEPMQIDITIDWNDIKPYYQAGLFYSNLQSPNLFRYGCRVYDDNELVFTGHIPIETISINEQEYTFSFTLVGTITAIQIAAKVDYELGPDIVAKYKTDEDGNNILDPAGNRIPEKYKDNIGMEEFIWYPFNDAVNKYNANPAFIKPTLSFNNIYDYLGNTTVNMYFPNYGFTVNFDQWKAITPILRNRAATYSQYSIGYYPLDFTPGGDPTNYQLILYYAKAWTYYQQGVRFHELKIVRVVLFIDSPLTYWEYHDDVHAGSGSAPLDTQLTAWLPGGKDIWFNSNNPPSFSYQSSIHPERNYSITMYQPGYAKFTGNIQGSQFVPNPEYVGDAIQTVIEALQFINCTVMQYPNGNLYITNKPSLYLDNGSLSTISLDSIIGTIQKRLQFQQSFDASGKFDFMLYPESYRKIIERYYDKVIANYRVIINFAMHGITQPYIVGNFIRIDNKNYVIVSVQKDRINYKTDFEAFGEL